MKYLAFITLAAAWVCVFLAPKSTASRLLQFVLFGLLGTVFTLAGGLAYWWDSGMRPSGKSAFVFVCGVLTLLSQVSTGLQGFLGNEGGTDWPDRTSRRK